MQKEFFESKAMLHVIFPRVLTNGSGKTSVITYSAISEFLVTDSCVFTQIVDKEAFQTCP